MKFDIKEMYRYLLSHTFPGMLLGLGILYYLKWIEDINVYKFVNAAMVNSQAIFILGVYSLSTCLGFIVDGIHHFSYEDIHGDNVKKNNSKLKYLSISNDHNYEIYKHYIEDDLWYPYETYANVSVVMFVMMPLAFYWIIELSIAPIPIKTILCIIYYFVLSIIIYTAKSTYEENIEEESDFTYALCSERLSAKFEDNTSLLENICHIEEKSFNKTWLYDDYIKYYESIIADKNNILITLYFNNMIIGYLLAIKHNEAVDDLKNYDPYIKEDLFNNKYYVESIAILPEYRGMKGLYILLDELVIKCKELGISKLSMHARVNNMLSSKIQELFNVDDVRNIANWKYYNYEEPTDYIEVSVDKYRKISNT